MTISAQTGVARVTVVAPYTRVDVALPHAATLAELLPPLLRLAGEDVADRGTVHGGWALARLGERPLDTGLTIESLCIRDGDLLHLRPRRLQIPPPVFDDVVDAIATTTRQRAARWQPSTTRRCGLTLGGLVLTSGAVVAPFAGPNRAIVAAAAGLLSVLLILAGAALARALDDSGAGTVLAISGLAYAFAAGLIALAPDTGIASMGRSDVLLACSALTVAAVLSAILVGDFPVVFDIAAGVGLLGGLAALISLLTGATTHGAAAVTAAVTMALAPLLPVVALRLARIPLPPVPADAADFQNDASSLPGPGTGARAELAESHLTGLLGACCAVVTGAEVMLVLSGRGDARVLCAIIALTLLLRDRVYTDRTQRLIVLSAGSLGGAALLIGLGTDARPALRLIATMGSLLVVGALAIIVALVVPGRPVSPYGTRALDIIEILLLVSVIPVALAVLGSYNAVRGIVS